MSATTSTPQPTGPPGVSSRGDSLFGGIGRPLLPAIFIAGGFIILSLAMMAWRYVRVLIYGPDVSHLLAMERRRQRWEEQELERRRVQQMKEPKLWELWVADGETRHEKSRSAETREGAEGWGGIQPLSAEKLTDVSPQTPSSSNSSLDKSSPHREKDNSSLQVACILSMPRRPENCRPVQTEYSIGVLQVEVDERWSTP